MPTTLEQIQYGFDRDSRRTWQKRPLTDTQDQHYSYDALSQVGAAARGSLNLNATAISGVPAAKESWDYDPTGNWRGYHSAANGTPTLDQHRVHDRGNRLTQIEENPHNMILDRVGRMRQMAPDAQGDWDGTLELTWDAWSRITRVKNNGTVVGNYQYDGLHGRIIREMEGETLHSYYNDAWRPVEERKNVETTASISYLWGARHRDDLVRRDRAVSGTTLSEKRYVLMDYFNPAAITDESGVVKERYAFSAFGVRRILNPDFTVRSSSECGMEFAFQGQFLDGESSLMNYGYRYYSPLLGRWTCKDPIGERGGLNLCGLVGNDPVNSVDFLGLAEVQKRDCRFTVYIGHTHHIRRQHEQNQKRPGDRSCGVSCYSTQLNVPQGAFGNNVIPNSPGVSRYLYPDPQNRPEKSPDYDPEQDGDLDDYAYGAIANAESQAQAECANTETCCKTIEVKVTCTRGGAGEAAMQQGGWASYENLGTKHGAYKNPCNYQNIFDCKTKKWSGLRIDHWQTAHPTSPAKP
jgi:RHS repeat-associated protein